MSTLALQPLHQKRGLLLGTSGWLAVVAALAVLTVLIPLLNMVVPDGSAFHVSDYAVGLTGKILCYAICALAMDLIWGATGILSLGHGLFFALGGYGMGMYLMRQIGLDGNYKSQLPDFMVFLNWKELPWTWALSDSFIAQMLLVVLVPGVLALVFGWFAFRSRIKGVYFFIITQALTFAAMLLFFRNETGFGGNNGFTDFKRILNVPIATPSTRITLFIITSATLDREQQIRPGVAGHSGRGNPGHVHRLQPIGLQAEHLDIECGDVRHCRRVVCAASGHHQPQRDEPVGRH